MSKRKWWVENSFDGSEFAHKINRTNYGNWRGPFNTLGDAKKDAIAYHNATILTARNAIMDIRLARVSDYKGKD